MSNRWFILILILLVSPVFAVNQALIRFDLDNVDLRSALRILGKGLKRTVVLSPEIEGVVTLHVQGTSAQEIFEVLLKTKGLIAWRSGSIWYIAPRETMIKQKQEEAKWREQMEAISPLQSRLWQIHYAKAEDLAHWLREGPSSLLSKQGQVHADTRSNHLFVRDTASRITMISSLIKKLDVPLKQVLIEARLAAVDSDYERELGFRFPVLNSNQMSGESRMEGQGLPGQYNLLITKLADNSLLDVKLAALENQGHGELISSPTLFTANQQMASIEAGEEIPYQEASSSGATSVVFKKAVLRLKVTPQILPDNKIMLQLQINQDRPNARMVLGVPMISTRQIVTNVLVPNGHTIILGGIYEINQENNEESLPILGKIPIMGWLFQVNKHHHSKRELLIFISPKVVE